MVIGGLPLLEQPGLAHLISPPPDVWQEAIFFMRNAVVPCSALGPVGLRVSIWLLLVSFVVPQLQAQQRPPEILWASHPDNRAVDGVNSPITSVYPGASVSDADGNIFVTGTFSGVVSLGGNSLTNTVPGFTAGDVLLIKYAPDGRALWVRQAGGNFTDQGRSLAADGAGGVYLSGTTTSDTAFFGTNSISSGLFLARYDADGNCHWVRRAGSWQETWSSPVNSATVLDCGLAVDSAGNPVVGGRFNGNPMFGGTRVFSQFSQLIHTNGIVLTNRTLALAASTEDIFFAKFSPAGNLLWATNHGGTNAEYASAIALDSADNIYASGGYTKNTVLGGTLYTNSMFLAKFSPTGAPLWNSNLSEPTNNNTGTALSVAVDASNRVTVAFSTAMPVFRLGTNSFTNEVQSPNFSGVTGSGLAQFSSAGALLWMKRAPFNVNGNSGTVGLSLAADKANNLYLRSVANLMTSRFALGDPGLSVLKMQWEGGELWTNTVKSVQFQMTLGDGQGASVGFATRGLPGISVAPDGRVAVIANIYGDRTTPGYIGWTNLLAFTNGTGNNLLTYQIESNYAGVLPQFVTQPTNMLFQPPLGLTNYALARAWPVADYRWFMVSNGVSVRIGTNQLLTLASTTVTNVTTYFVVASNLVGQSTSSVAFAQPLLAILPSTNPTNSILLGGSGTLSANATGTTAISYQWRFNGTNIVGATAPALVLNNVATNASGLYTVVACNAWGCLTSTPPITVRVIPPGSVDGNYVTSLTGEYGLARLPDGRLLGAGGGIYPTLFRALTNGAFDTNFYLKPPASGGTYAWWRTGNFDQQGPRAFLVEPDGRIVVGGNFPVFFTNYPSGSWASVGKMVRLTADGLLDRGFNVGGGPYDPSDAVGVSGINALVRQPDGKLIAAGWFRNFNGVARTNIVRLETNGAVDATFAGQTFAYGSDYNNVGNAFALALQPDGKILVGGNWQRVSGQDRPVLIRLNTNGTLDESFVVMRVKTGSSTWPANGFCIVQSIALLPSGKILIAGNGLRLAQTGYDNNAIFQLNADGTVDTNFVAQATGGMTSSSVVAVQPDGKILLGGSPTVNRFLATGAADPDWKLDPSLASPNTSRIMIEPGGYTALMAGNYGIKRILLTVDTGAVTPPNFPTGSAIRLPNGQFGFTTCGQMGQTLVIQGSTNLVDWVSLQTNVVGSGCIDFIDTQAPLIPNRYYRVAIVP